MAGQMYKIEDFLTVAEKHGASDVHLAAGENPHIRIKGKLRSLGKEDAVLTEENIRTLMDATLHESQKARCQALFRDNGSVDYSYEVDLGGRLVRYRIQAYRALNRLSLALRRIRYEIPTFEQLNLPPIYQKVMENPEQKGIIIIGGETGSGKSSTLAAMIGHAVTIQPGK